MPTADSARLKPASLQAGDTVGIVAPAGAIQKNQLDAGCLTLWRMGYKPFYLESIFDQDTYFAGTVERRARELEEMFARPEVRAIICARGGYGSNYLLPRLDLEKIRSNPKIFVGYSDITSLLTWFTDAADLVTFHGPMVAKDYDAEDRLHQSSWMSATTGKPHWEITGSASNGVLPLVSGKAEGILYGGCLSMLVASLRTPYEIKTEGKILFIEDVNTRHFQVDRMLMHLKLAGKFAGVRGMIFGEMLKCGSPGEPHLPEVVKRLVGDLGIPVAYGLHSGHVTEGNITLPFGVRVSLSVHQDVRLTFLEAATQAVVPAAQEARVPSR